MRSTFKAALLYFLAVFAIGFVLGTLRVLFVEPTFGKLPAVSVEAPVMLAASWWICGKLIERLRIPHRISDRLAMGAMAFALLMTAEFCLAVFAFEQTSAEYLSNLQTVAGMLGLSSQILFGAFPVLRK